MRVLVIGAGLLGEEFIKVAGKEFVVYGTYHTQRVNMKNMYKLDITNKKNTFELINKIKPDAIVHTAAYTDVDGCESNKETAYKINVKGTKNVATVAKSLNAKLVYISTDYVFDGKKGMYKEEDKPKPINYYGYTKLRGEEIVKEICSNWIIARTCVLYGKEKYNFVTWIINELKNSRNINVVTDQFITPTYNLDISQQILELIKKEKTGIFHTAGSERISRYDFALKIAEIFNLDNTLINRIKMEHLNWIAKRPRDSSLNTNKISKIKKPLAVGESLKIMKNF